MVQDPEEAQYDGMPRSAIASGVVDYVLHIDKMPSVLLRYVRHWYVNGAAVPLPLTEKASDQLHAVLGQVRARVKYDFSCYKKGTLTRRIQRRMGLSHIESMGEYVEFLRQNQDEVVALYKDLLISVTNFFREPEAWQALESEVIEPLVRNHPPNVPIRVWVPGCATGEEAYSIAMLLIERLQVVEKGCEIQIFASDIDRDALAIARTGVYPENIAADVSVERLRQFFTKGEHTYRINKDIRESVVFTEQNLISDPPFSKLDLISCRNLMIYLEAATQKKILTMFHFALREGGCLFLGNSETINQQHDVFEALSPKWRIYRRIGPVRLDKLELPVKTTGRARFAPEAILDKDSRRMHRLSTLAQLAVMQRFAPACVLVNRKAEVLYLHGPIDQYLQLPSGELEPDLLAMARPGLRTKLRSALHQAIHESRLASFDDGRVKRGEEYFPVRVMVEPLRHPEEAEGLLLVSFEEASAADRVRVVYMQPETGAPDKPESTRDFKAVIHDLDGELRTTREDLQTTIEDLETSNEEFKASNEEITSINEELQSTNEELETSKEELQSLNEELQTVNNQLEQKVAELETANNDLANLLASTDIATIFLDRWLCLRQFTPATTRLLRVIATDVGRSIRDFAQNFTDEDLLPDAETVLQRLAPIEKEIVDREGRWYMRRIVPYRTGDDRIDGVVVTFTEITLRKQHEQTLIVLNEQLAQRVAEGTAELDLAQAALQTTPSAVKIVEWDGTITRWHRGAERLFGYTAAEALGRNISLLFAPDRAGEFSQLRERLEHGETVEDFETVQLHKEGTRLDVALTVSVVSRGTGRCLCVIARDLRDQRLLEQQIAELSEHERQHLSHELHDSLGQQVTAIGMLAAILKDDLGADSPHTPSIAKIEDSIDQAKQQVRALCRGLLPVELDAHGLRVALQQLAQETTAVHRVSCRFECPEEVPLEDNFTATQIYLIAREAVHNAVKHSGGSEFVIRLADHDGVRLSVSDNGHGFPNDAEQSTGIGLRVMRYRCTLAGGSLRFEPAPSGGAIVSCHMPSGRQPFPHQPLK